MVMEVTGKQFQWMFRYPGKDGELGKKDYKLIDPTKSNPLGQDWSDKANEDDVVSTGIMHLVVNKPVKLLINSQDVIHDVGLPYFRLKMDAVPGVPTTLWFTPTITTAEMKQKTGDPDFVYELACDQLCGNGHYSMRATIIVETQAEFDKWVASQQSQYQIAMAPATDSTQTNGAQPATDSTNTNGMNAAADSTKTVAAR
jgi:cytochrome c oxidase subunit 2